jgi:hypothetical protein
MFTWGKGACPTAGGASGPDQIMINPGRLDATKTFVTPTMSINCGVGSGSLDERDITHFAHELGHYLGLDHTFVATQNGTLAEAQTLFTASGCNRNVFEGDGISDTPPHPAINAQEAQLIVTSTVLTDCSGFFNAVPFPLPRTNIMSYLVSNRAYVGARDGRCDSTNTTQTTTASYGNCKELTAGQAHRLMGATVNITGLWSGYFADYNGKTRWWRLE